MFSFLIEKNSAQYKHMFSIIKKNLFFHKHERSIDYINLLSRCCLDVDNDVMVTPSNSNMTINQTYLSCKHGCIWRGFITICLHLHATSDSSNSFPSNTDIQLYVKATELVW